MAIVSVEEEVARLRSYLNPIIQGPNVDAVLYAIASASSSYLVNNINSVNAQLYIATASGTYLDQLLSAYGITRPSEVGLGDDAFRQIGIQVKNRKLVRDLMDNILDIMFGDEFVKATSNSTTYEPYALADGDTLIVNFDENTTTTIVFSASQFEDIAAATAQEVADAITTYLSSVSVRGAAIAQNDGNGPYVQLISETIGPASSITVLGGSAQNELMFSSAVAAGGNMSTQWTLTLRPGGKIRFTWSGGTNPNIGNAEVGDYVNVYGGGFASSTNEGTFVLTAVIGGAVSESYFEVYNPLGTTGIITQGADDAVLFFNPVKKTLLSRPSYAAIYQTQSQVLQVFMPATTQVVRRTRSGSAYLHSPPNGTFVLNANPSPGDAFSITTTVDLIAGSNFTIGGTPAETAANIVAAVNLISGLVAYANSTQGVDGTEIVADGSNTVAIWNDSQANTLTITYTGLANIIASGALGDPTSLVPAQYGPYMYDPAQPFVVSSTNTILTQELDATKPRVFTVANSSAFPNSFGYLIFDYGTESQEGPVPYICTPSPDTLLISPSYTIKTPHQVGASVFLIGQNSEVSLTTNGTDWPFYETDVVAGRIYAQDLIESVAATGINVIFTILYPGDIGLGKWGTPYSEITYIYGDNGVGGEGLVPGGQQ